VVWLHSFLFPTLDGVSRQLHGTSGFAPREKSTRCPINKRLSGQKGRYGRFEEKNSCLYHKLNQEPWFNNPWPSYYGD